jgi:catechol 2,3-dioxygenase-like lactoylglutathione lyase family enzyme
MATIRHLVFNTTDPDRLAKFYVEVMGMEMLPYEPGRGYSLTDGYFNIAIHNVDVEGKPGGFNHFGFLIDDTKALMERLERLGYKQAKKRPGNRHYAEYRVVDPDGNLFDISENGYLEIRPGQEAWEPLEGAAPAKK